MQPDDPVQKAKMKIAAPLPECLLGGCFAMFLKKKVDGEEINTLKEKVEKVEEFLAKNCTEHPFAMNTLDPTMLDFHFYTSLVRIQFL